MQYIIPSEADKFLFNGYRLQAGKAYNYRNLTTLIRWYESLNIEYCRYNWLHTTLSYSSDQLHDKGNISKLVDYLKRSFKVNGKRVPLHIMWSLEHSHRLDKTGKAKGFHYHLVVCFSRELTAAIYPLDKKIKGYWARFGETFTRSDGAVRSPEVHYYNHTGRKLRQPILNTCHDHYLGIFHHLSYLAKSDPTQELPEGYIGKGFGISQVKEKDLIYQSPIQEKRKRKRRKRREKKENKITS